ncbi:hypothetical protein [Burkholderia ubonensis]|uniref:hypothetical protein n=1 Tax=Burkholderia ubonensis TaxID=101571 RepID=UPI000755449D|nr:hypothetical protein [Burkholderia ubonensis]KWK77689.1 hypothetical protein WM15_26780 [Burkholderia ubonensis]
MNRFADAKRLLVLLERRSIKQQQNVQRQRDELVKLDMELVENRAAIARLRDRLAGNAQQTQFVRSELMRVRSKQAVIGFEIACKIIEEAELIERREDVEAALHTAQKVVMALKQRQQKHCDWFAQRRIERDMQRESAMESDILEVRSYGFDQQ